MHGGPTTFIDVADVEILGAQAFKELSQFGVGVEAALDSKSLGQVESRGQDRFVLVYPPNSSVCSRP